MTGGWAIVGKLIQQDKSWETIWIYLLPVDETQVSCQLNGLVITPSNCWWSGYTQCRVESGQFRFDSFAAVARIDKDDIRKLAIASPQHLLELDYQSTLTQVWQALTEWNGIPAMSGLDQLKDLIPLIESSYQSYYFKERSKGSACPGDIARYVGITSRRVWGVSQVDVPADCWGAITLLIDQLLTRNLPSRAFSTASTPTVERVTRKQVPMVEIRHGGYLKTINVPYTTMTPEHLVSLNHAASEVVNIWAGRIPVNDFIWGDKFLD